MQLRVDDVHCRRFGWLGSIATRERCFTVTPAWRRLRRRVREQADRRLIRLGHACVALRLTATTSRASTRLPSPRRHARLGPIGGAPKLAARMNDDDLPEPPRDGFEAQEPHRDGGRRVSRAREALRRAHCRGRHRLDVAAGTCFGLLGPNGAGKTTTLRMIYGVTHPSAEPCGSSGSTSRARRAACARDSA